MLKYDHRLLQKNNYYKIENLSKASGGGIHVLSSKKIVTKKKLLQKQLNQQVLLQN